MSSQKIKIVQDSGKAVDSIFAALADHNHLGKVFGVPVRRVRDGEGDVNGVGSVRRIGVGPLAVEETVTALTTNRTIDYRISKGGGPVRNHSGQIRFSGSSRGSSVTWTIQFDAMPSLLGPVLKLVLGQAIRAGLKRIS
jgi:hypothetical protein